MAKRIPYLKETGKQAILDFLNVLTEEDIIVLEQHFQEKITVERLNYSVAQDFKLPINNPDLCNQLCDIVDFNYFTMWRDDEFLHISFWR